MCVSGVLNTIIYLLLLALYANGFKDIYSYLHLYMARWTWPRRIHTAVASLFEPKRETSNKKAHTFKAQASELLSLVPVLAFFIAFVALPSGICDLQCKAFLAAADVLDMLLVANMGHTSPADLAFAIGLFRCPGRWMSQWNLGRPVLSKHRPANCYRLYQY